jgi:cobalamin transport system substrate-binding protein
MCFPVPAPAYGIEIVDDTGHKIRLKKPATRIIALYGAYNEILAAMGLESRIVGRTKTDVLPPSIVSRPSIGTHMRPNVELVLSLKPDLVIQGAGRRQAMIPVNQLRAQGLNVAVFNPATFSELFSVIEKLGRITGESGAAMRLTDDLKKRLADVKKKLTGASYVPKVFFEVRYPNLLAAGAQSIVNDVIEKAGGINCIALDKKLVRINMESLIACNPDFYVVQKGAMNRNPGSPEERPHFKVLSAVKNHNVLFVDEQVFSRPGPRSVEAVEQLARTIHPELWRAREQ